MTSYILIDSRTRAPVPLPYHTSDSEGLCCITSFNETEVFVKDESGYQSQLNGWYSPGDYGLELITEADFMAEREQ